MDKWYFDEGRWIEVTKSSGYFNYKPDRSNMNFQKKKYTIDSYGNIRENKNAKDMEKSNEMNMDINKLEPVKVKFYADKTTVIWWNDNTKTSVVCDKEDTFNKETGVAMCYLKKIYGNTGKYMNKINKALDKAEDNKSIKKSKYCYVCLRFSNNKPSLKGISDKSKYVKFPFRAIIIAKSDKYICVKFPKDSIQYIYKVKNMYSDISLGTIVEDFTYVFESNDCFEDYIKAYCKCLEYNEIP